MAKRFVDTKLWSEDWFLNLPKEYKLFWYYLLSSCDHAGFYKVNMKSFSLLNEVKINSKDVIDLINVGKERIMVINETTWFIPDFFVFQYGNIFNINNRVHESAYLLLLKFDLNLGSIRGLKLKKCKFEYGPKHSKYGTSIETNLGSNWGQIDPTNGVKDKDNIHIDNKEIGTRENFDENPVVLPPIDDSTYTVNEMIAFTFPSYKSRNDEFKKLIKEDLYTHYQWFVQLLVSNTNHFANLLQSPKLITIYQFRDILTGFSDDEIIGGLELVAAKPINKEEPLVWKLKQYIGYFIRDNQRLEGKGSKIQPKNAAQYTGDIKNYKNQYDDE